MSGRDGTVGAVRLIAARSEVSYSGRLNAFLPESTRFLTLEDGGSALVRADAGDDPPSSDSPVEPTGRA
jgi:RecB family endonuclease NucS